MIPNTIGSIRTLFTVHTRKQPTHAGQAELNGGSNVFTTFLMNCTKGRVENMEIIRKNTFTFLHVFS